MSGLIFKPHDYQDYARDLIRRNKEVMLLLDMGLGKTIICLTAIVELLLEDFAADSVLVIAPKKVAEDTWPKEVAKWAHTSGLTTSIVMGSAKKRTAALRKRADIYIINRENVSWLVDTYEHHWPFRFVIIDEISSFKSHKSKRFKNLKKVRPLIKRIVGLTGTPTPNTLLDLWAPMYLVDRGQRLFSSYQQFQDYYFEPADMIKNSAGQLVVSKYKPRPWAEQAIYDRISDITVSMKAVDWLNMPDKMEVDCKVELTGKALAQYKELEREYILEFAGGDVVADNGAVLSQKLWQLANGSVYDEHKGVQHIHDAKLDLMADIVERAWGKPILVFYWFKHDLERILQKFPYARTLNGTQDVTDWNNGDVPLLLAHPASSGHGLNLQKGGNHIIWFSNTWSYELYAQAIARLYRQGQDQPFVLIQRLCVAGSIDEDILAALEYKEDGQDRVMEAVKARIEEVMKR